MNTNQPLPDPGFPSPFPSTEELTISQRKVEVRGGRLVSGPHTAKTVRYEDKTAGKVARLGNRPRTATVTLTGCGHTALAEIPLDEDADQERTARVCLICDGLFLSPKYGGTA